MPKGFLLVAEVSIGKVSVAGVQTSVFPGLPIPTAGFVPRNIL